MQPNKVRECPHLRWQIMMAQPNSPRQKTGWGGLTKFRGKLKYLAQPADDWADKLAGQPARRNGKIKNLKIDLINFKNYQLRF